MMKTTKLNYVLRNAKKGPSARAAAVPAAAHAASCTDSMLENVHFCPTTDIAAY